MTSPGLRIGEVAQSSGLPVKTIRFYCDQGLISPANRSQGGYRLFDQTIYSELSLIRSLRAMDVSLSELRQILEVRRSGVCNCAALKATFQSKLDGIEQRMMELYQMRLELAEFWRNGRTVAESSRRLGPERQGRRRRGGASQSP
jgi:DNA-binding transcriptional MerR regulator